MIRVSQLMETCIRAGQRAGNRIKSIHSSGNLNCVEKGDGQDKITGRPMKDLQTEADRQSESIIFSTILKQFPGIKIVGEEETSGFNMDDDRSEVLGSPNGSLAVSSPTGGLPSDMGEIEEAHVKIFVDPLDGTSEFVRGRLHCVSVIIGIAYKGKAFAGVIYRPFPSAEYPDECMYGVVGFGAFIDQQKIDPTVIKRNEPRRLTTTLSKSNRVIERVFELLQPCVNAKDGGAGWKSWLVINGQVDCYQYPRPGTKRWDILAADAIVTALGGVCTDACGRRIEYDIREDYTNVWGVLLCRDKEWHFSKVVPACHRALTEAANDPEYKQWPHGLAIPPIEISSL